MDNLNREDYEALYGDATPDRGPGLPWQIWALLACAAVVIALSGCASFIDEHQAAPQGWPQLMVRDNVVSGYEVIRRCYKYQPAYMKALGSIPFACAEVRFDLGTCDIWRAHDATPEIIEHERLHCAGYSHVGETWAADALAAYKGLK